MIKDPRFNVVRTFIKNRTIKTFPQIFDYIPKSVVSQVINTNNNRFGDLIDYPMDFRLRELAKLARAFGVDTKILIDIALKDEHKSKPGKKKEITKDPASTMVHSRKRGLSAKSNKGR